jgi:uncharacterized membrane protein
MPKKAEDKSDLINLIQQQAHLSPSKARKLLSLVQHNIEITHKSGPFPSPEDYEWYHEIDPDLTTVIKRMAEKEQEYAHARDAVVIEKTFKQRRVGQIFALIVAIGAMIGGFYTVLQGYEAGGTIIAALGVGGIVGQFLKSLSK